MCQGRSTAAPGPLAGSRPSLPSETGPPLSHRYWPDNYSADSRHDVWQPEGHVGKLGDFPCFDPKKVGGHLTD